MTTLPYNYVTPAMQLVAVRLGQAYTAPFAQAVRPDLDWAAGQLAAKFPCLASISTGTLDYQAFTQAVGLLTAARVWAAVLTGEGTVQSVRTAEGSQTQFVSPNAGSPAEWVREASEALSVVSCIRKARAATAGRFSMFALTGRRRLMDTLMFCSPLSVIQELSLLPLISPLGGCFSDGLFSPELAFEAGLLQGLPPMANSLY